MQQAKSQENSPSRLAFPAQLCVSASLRLMYFLRLFVEVAGKNSNQFFEDLKRLGRTQQIVHV
jgi:hypothetical protein